MAEVFFSKDIEKIIEVGKDKQIKYAEELGLGDIKCDLVEI
jgi:uncharacterized Fe-S center protein